MVGRKWKRSVMAVMMAGLVLVVAELGMTMQVQAAEAPAITNLVVAETDDGCGVIAQCSYQNYTDYSGCEMRLYLYKMENDTTVLKTQKRLPFSDSGEEKTEPLEVEEGTYLAVVTMDYGTNIRQYSSRDYYKVRKVDGKYEVTVEVAHTETEGQKDENVSCNHNMEYFLVKQATSTSDGVLAYQCSICGAVFKYVEVPNSAYATFLRETAASILGAGDSKVNISTDRWMSFDRNVFEAIKSRPDVTVIVDYQYRGEQCQVKIPAGADVEKLMDENGFCGFRYIEEILNQFD
ncbi:MAG: hypothetical protein PUC12_07670 [Clostridiales bacterium]|nr:hypothetical protein [Clostridiales bacterium]